MAGRIARLVLVVAALAGCSSTTSTFAPSDVAGVYTATTISAVINGATTDLLSRGASITATLGADGSLSGRVVIPVVAGVQTVAIDDDLAGSFVVIKDKVQFKPTGGSYLNGFLFTADPPELRGYVSFQDATRQGQLTIKLRHQ